MTGKASQTNRNADVGLAEICRYSDLEIDAMYEVNSEVLEAQRPQ